MSAADQLEHIPGDVLELAQVAMGALGMNADDAARAACDIEAVRETLRLLPQHRRVRRLASAQITEPTTSVARLLNEQDAVSAQELKTVLDGIHARADAARRASRSGRRGTAQDRQIARLEAELVRFRREIETAQANASHQIGRASCRERVF